MGKRQQATPKQPKATAPTAQAATAPATPEPTKATTKGRKSDYTPELGELICEGLKEGMTLRGVCERIGNVVTESTVRGWATDLEHPFYAQYARAREIGYQRMADQIIDIADDNAGDTVADGEGTGKVNHENVQRARLRVEARKWILSKALPKIYGDKVALTDADGGSIKVEFTS